MKSAVTAAREGRAADDILRPEEQETPEGYEPGRVGDAELVYVAFDVLYVDDGVGTCPSPLSLPPHSNIFAVLFTSLSLSLPFLPTRRHGGRALPSFYFIYFILFYIGLFYFILVIYDFLFCFFNIVWALLPDIWDSLRGRAVKRRPHLSCVLVRSVKGDGCAEQKCLARHSGVLASRLHKPAREKSIGADLTKKHGAGGLGQSVINRALEERIELLKSVIGPYPEEGIYVGKAKMKARVVAGVPGTSFYGLTVASRGRTEADIQSFFDNAVRQGVLSRPCPPLLLLQTPSVCR